MKYHMWVFAIAAFAAMGYAYNGRGSSYSKKRIIELITLVMSLFLGLRTWWMADLIKYHTQYVACGGENWRETVFSKPENIGMRLFFRFEYLLTGGNYQIALLIIAAFCMSCLGYTIYKYSVSPYWSYVMYIAMGFYFFTFSGLKQSIAMGFLLLAFQGIVEKKPVYFLVMTLMGGIFHAPALIFLPAYLIARMSIDRRYWLYLLILVGLFFVFKTQLVEFLNDLYYEEELLMSDRQVGGRFIMMSAMLLGGAFLRPPSTKDSVYMKVFNLMIVSTLLQSFSTFGNEFTRLADYYFQFVILYVPFVFEYRDSKYRHQLSMRAKPAKISFNWRSYQVFYLVVTVFSVWFFYNYIKTDISGILDYKFFWEVIETPWGS